MPESHTESTQAPSGTPATVPAIEQAAARYWKRNLAVMTLLLVIWAAAGLGAGVLFADVLNQWSLGGYPLGFWFAQQGSIVVFVMLILVYALIMNRLDRIHHDEVVAILAAEEAA